MTKEQINIGSLESNTSDLSFTPKDLDHDSNLLPINILIPLRLGLEVLVRKSRELEYSCPDSMSPEDFQENLLQVEKNLSEYRDFISSLKPY